MYIYTLWKEKKNGNTKDRDPALQDRDIVHVPVFGARHRTQKKDQREAGGANSRIDERPLYGDAHYNSFVHSTSVPYGTGVLNFSQREKHGMATYTHQATPYRVFYA